MMRRDVRRAWGVTGVLAVALVLACFFAVSGCSNTDDGSAGVCQPVCENILQCKAEGYEDTDLASMTMESCLQWCADLRADPGFEKMAECASSTTDCAKLDDECDAI